MIAPSCGLVSARAFREALDADDYTIYQRQLEPIVTKLRALELRSALFRAGWKRIKRKLLGLRNRLRPR